MRSKQSKINRSITPLFMVLFVVWMLAGCAGSAPAVGPEMSENGNLQGLEQDQGAEREQGLQQGAEQGATPDGTGSSTDTAAEPDKDQQKRQITQQMEAELFDLYYNQYSELYNEMVSQFMIAQAHFQQGNLERAKLSAIRAASILPSEPIYEFVLIILARLADEPALVAWTEKLEELRKVKAAGGQITAEGTIIQPN